MRERVLVIRAEGEQAQGIRALEARYPDLEFVYCESFLSGIVEASRGGVRAMLARVDGGPRRLTEAVGALREAGGRKTKIVLCCSPEHEPQAKEAMAGGADDYLIEPVQVADVDRAIGYGPVEAATSADFQKAPTASLEELSRLGELLELMDSPPTELLQKAADLIRQALGASGATVVIEGTMAQSGDVGQPVLTSPLREGQRVAGQVSVAERQQPEIGRGLTAHRSPTASTRAPYTLGDARKLEEYAGVLSRVIAAAKKQRGLRRLAVIDEATGLPNRRYLRERLAAILQQALAGRFPVTVLLFDVDDFKSYNDRYGHAAGDEILRAAGQLFRKNCREQDVVARYGGDEFAVIFHDPHGPREPGSKPPAEALFVLDRFKNDLSRVSLKTSKHQGTQTDGMQGSRNRESEGGTIPRAAAQPEFVASAQQEEKGRPPSTITISGGLATYPWDASTVDGLLQAADEALLAAKRAGKNRVFVVGQ